MNNMVESTFFSHFHELRSRLIKCVVSVIIAFCILWIFRDDVIFILTWPLERALIDGQGNIILLSVMEKIFIHLKTVFVASLILSIPIILYQVWKFILPALYAQEKKYTGLFLGGSIFLFLAGLLVCYYIILPIAFTFLLEYSNNYEGFIFNVKATAPLQIHLKEHLKLTLNLLFIFGVIFELPLVMIFINKVGLVNVDAFKQYRKYALVMGMIFAALVTPPDPLTMIGLSIPIVFLYEIGIQLSIFFSHRSSSQQILQK